MAEPFTTYKLIVLYMAKHSKETLTNSQISEFILDRDYTDYFQLQKVLSELVETELLRKRTISNSSYNPTNYHLFILGHYGFGKKYTL